MPRLFAIAAFVVALLPASAGAQQGCRFQLGFKAIADQIPGMVGQCLEDERFNAANGNAEQRTTAHHGNGGLLVWRKADNWTAFTDGHRSWVNGPNGLQQRLNTERFDWENDAAPPSAVPPQAAPPPPPPAAVTIQFDGIELSEFDSGWSRDDREGMWLPRISFRVVNRTNGEIVSWDDRLYFDAEFVITQRREAFGGICVRQPPGNLRASFAVTIHCYGTSGWRTSAPPSGVAVEGELYRRLYAGDPKSRALGKIDIGSRTFRR